MDFMRGAALSKRGRPIIALPATVHTPHEHVPDTDRSMLKPIDGLLSRIVPVLSPGAAVTTCREQVEEQLLAGVLPEEPLCMTCPRSGGVRVGLEVVV